MSALDNVEASDRYQQTSARVASERLLRRMREHHDYSVRVPEGYVKPEPEPIIIEAEPSPEYKELWFGIISDRPLEPVIPSIEKIQKAVSRHFGVTREALVSEQRHAKIVHPRQVAIYLCRKLTANSFPQIGRKFGGRDHSTSLHSVRTIENKIQTDEQIAADIAKLTAILAPHALEAAE